MEILIVLGIIMLIFGIAVEAAKFMILVGLVLLLVGAVGRYRR